MTDELKSPYSAKALADHQYREGCWNGQRIGIFHGDEKIGEYLRNYHSFGESTFAPFQQGSKWFALYSKDYTCTRLMELPACNDIGGEEPCGHGFCPVELYVPVVCTQDITTPKPGNPRHDREWDGKRTGREYERQVIEHDKAFDKWMDENPFTYKYPPFGFVAGCIWGDDCSWKIQFIDLSRVSHGVIVRDDRFGYIELPAGVKLKDAIDISNYDHDYNFVNIAIQKRFAINGEAVEA